jgi:hypothetical protein
MGLWLPYEISMALGKIEKQYLSFSGRNIDISKGLPIICRRGTLSIHVIIFFIIPTSTNEDEDDEDQEDEIDEDEMSPKKKYLH